MTRNGERYSTYDFFKLQSLVHLTGEAIDQEATTVVIPSFSSLSAPEGIEHGILEQVDCDFHGDDLALLDVVLDEFTVL